MRCHTASFSFGTRSGGLPASCSYHASAEPRSATAAPVKTCLYAIATRLPAADVLEVGSQNSSEGEHTTGGIARFILIDRAMSRFLREPVTVRGAAATIVTATAPLRRPDRGQARSSRSRW